MAAYGTVDAALRALDQVRKVTARVSVAGTHDLVTISVQARGGGVRPAMLASQDAADRVGALGGRYELGGQDGEPWVRAEIPCGS